MATAAKGRFWGGDDSDTETSSGTESSGSQADGKQGAGGAGAKVQSRWGNAQESDSSDSEDENRVARSAKDRTFDSLTSAIKVIANQIKINNWVGIQEGECRQP